MDKLTSKFVKLSQTRVFLYVVAFFSVTTVIGYLALNNIDAVLFFALIGVVAHQFSRNMAIVLLIAVLGTNLIMGLRGSRKREGMDDATTTTTTTDTTTTDENADVEGKLTPEQKKAVALLKKEPTVKDAKKKMAKGSVAKEAVDADAHQPLTEQETTEEGAPEAMSAMSSGSKNAGQAKGGASRIDYASTLESAYTNLEKSLGAGGIKQLTKDTSQLMAQQKELFESMKQMAPMIDNAKSMLEGFDMKSLSNMANMAAGLTGKKYNGAN